jgi:hypothetical protein
VELDSIDERALVDRAGVCGALTQRLAVGLAGSSHVLPGNRRERDELDFVDLDLPGADSVAATLLDSGPLPQPDRERDVSGQDVIAQLAAELHIRDASWWHATSRVVVRTTAFASGAASERWHDMDLNLASHPLSGRFSEGNY